MNILSIYYWHNATASYLEDWKLKYVIHEEKFDNIKNSTWAPLKAIDYIKNKCDLSKVDKISIVNTSIYKSIWESIKTRDVNSSTNFLINS